MNTKNLQEHKCLKIAEACGLDVIHDPAGPKDRPDAWKTGYFTRSAADQRRRSWPSSTVVRVIPNYFEDHGAMYGAWISRNQEERVLMHQTLMDIVNQDFPEDQDGCGVRENMPLEMWVILTFEASLSQRVEAFGAALKLW